MEGFAGKSDLCVRVSGCTGSQETVWEATVVSRSKLTGN